MKSRGTFLRRAGKETEGELVQPAETAPNPEPRWIGAERWMEEIHLRGLIAIS